MSSNPPRIAVLGTRWLGAEILTRLHAHGFDLALLTTSDQDRAASAARALKITVTVKPDAIALMASDFPWRPDLILCAHSFRIVPGWAIWWSRLGAIGYHPSILPAHKGRTSVEDTVRSGARMTGGTVYWLTDSVDGGPPVVIRKEGVSRRLQHRVQILPNETAGQLWRRALAPLGAQMLEEAALGLLL
ncbi:hypothetical protein JI664_21880 [Rhodobacter sp. NTK016B]|uniref:formyltransferase family protein n=1 Tax=Rhodobacter sp. NTK016B TaxID=2759676 RepID=UPI001A8E0542|nr:formyltransferase family protein [Rhodobacter sp. NTK016B]MBN8294637.1 hypothetical protein [Rhodobacter sp. NTK016B]